jgi:hypothetical protein
MESPQSPESLALESHDRKIIEYVHIRFGILLSAADYLAWRKVLATIDIPLTLWTRPGVESPFITLNAQCRGPGSSRLTRRVADRAGYSSVGPELPSKKYQASSRPVGPHDVITGPVLMQYGDDAVTEFYLACLKPGQSHEPASLDLVVGPAMLLKLLHQDAFFEEFFVHVFRNLRLG